MDFNAHLDDDSWRALRRRDPDATGHFATHLASPCDTCEAYLLGRQDAGLDSQTDLLVLGMRGDPETPAAVDELAVARLRRKAGVAPRPGWQPVAAALGLAASLLVVAGVSVSGLRDTSGDDGIKGVAPLSLELMAAAHYPDDGGTHQIPTGAVLRPEAVVLLRYHSSEAGTALLLKQSGGGLEVLGQFELRPGTHDLSDEAAELVGVSLQGEAGRGALVLAARAGDRPPSAEEVEALLAGRPAPGSARRPPTVTRFDFEVAPGYPPR